MELKNKKIVFLGDSITEGVGTSSVDKVYWNVIAQRTGAVCVGYGISGTRIARQQHPDPNEAIDYQHFSTRVDDMDADADVVVVFGGTNDFGHGDAAFGDMTDRTEDSFYGAMHVLCRRLIERYPSAQLVFMTPTHRSSEENRLVNEKGVRKDHLLIDYVDAVREVAGYYSIPVLDLFRTSGIQPRIPAQQELFMPDGLHPSDAGNARIAEKLIAFLHTLA